jgi:hypothetical protein
VGGSSRAAKACKHRGASESQESSERRFRKEPPTCCLGARQKMARPGGQTSNSALETLARWSVYLEQRTRIQYLPVLLSRRSPLLLNRVSNVCAPSRASSTRLRGQPRTERGQDGGQRIKPRITSLGERPIQRLAGEPSISASSVIPPTASATVRSATGTARSSPSGSIASRYSAISAWRPRLSNV